MRLLSLAARLRIFVGIAALLLAGSRPLVAGDSGPLSALRGKASLVEEAALPPGCVLRLALQDLSQGSRHVATVATSAVQVQGPLPIAFELPYNENLIDANRLYGLAAVIADAGGRALWETRVPIRVLTLGNPKRVDLTLRPAEAPRAAAPEPTDFEVECEGLRFDVRLEGDSARVRLPDREIVLRKVDSSYGKKYTDGSTTLAISGEAVGAYFPAGRNYRNCRIAHEHAPGATP